MSLSATTRTLPLAGPPARSERAWQGTLTLALWALGFFAPFSTAGTAVAVSVLVGLAALTPLRVWRTGFWREGVLVLSVVLLAYIALRSVAEAGLSAAALHPLRKYHELLLLPLFWALLRLARRPQAFASGLIAGSLLLAALYWYGWATAHGPADPFGNWLHGHRISAGFTLAVSAYLLFEHTRLGHLRWSHGLLATLFVGGAVLFACDGRTGHLVLLLLVCCAGLRAVPRRARLAAIPAVLLVAIGLAALSAPVRERIQETIADARSLGEGKVNSTAVRLRLLRNGVSVARENWMLGTGWVGYREAFNRAGRSEESRGGGSLPPGIDGNPHSEYLLQLGAGGLLALLLFLAWVAWPIVRAVRKDADASPWHGALGCVALAFAVAALFNSVLLDFIEAHYYAGLLAWLLARRAED